MSYNVEFPALLLKRGVDFQGYVCNDTPRRKGRGEEHKALEDDVDFCKYGP